MVLRNQLLIESLSTPLLIYLSTGWAYSFEQGRQANRDALQRCQPKKISRRHAKHKYIHATVKNNPVAPTALADCPLVVGESNGDRTDLSEADELERR